MVIKKLNPALQAKKIRSEMEKEKKRDEDWKKQLEESRKKMTPFQRAKQDYINANNQLGLRGSGMTKSKVAEFKKIAEDLYKKENND